MLRGNYLRVEEFLFTWSYHRCADHYHVIDRATFQVEVDKLRVREKTHTRQVEVDASIKVIGPRGEVPLLEVFEGRTQLFASYIMRSDDQSAAHQGEGCTMNIGQVLELGYLALARRQLCGVLPGTV